ncbi:MAG: DUF11 domain-containing protein [Chloroflexota bacterium]
MPINASNMRILRVVTLLTFTSILSAFTILAIQTGSAQGESVLSGSSKTVDFSEAERGDSLSYTLVLSNATGSATSMIYLTDTIPADMTYISGTLSTPGGIGIIVDGSGVSGNVITWTGRLQGGTEAYIRYGTIISESAVIDAYITNTVQIETNSTIISRTAATQVISITEPSGPFMPMMSMPVDPPTVAGTTAAFSNSTYEWTVSWVPTEGITDTLYLLEESDASDFSNITNSYQTTDTSRSFTRSASTTANVYFYRVRVMSQFGSAYSEPAAVVVVPDPPTLASTRPTEVDDQFEYTVSWSMAQTVSGVDFVIEESNDPTFASGVNSATVSGSSNTYKRPATANNVWYYRVRLAQPETAPWSETHTVVSAYFDDFVTETGWDIRRQDLDDVNNVMTYEDDDYLKQNVKSRFDYFIVSPLKPAPEPPYRITARVRLEDPRNTVAYGLVFGGEWNGQTCPTFFPSESLVGEFSAQEASHLTFDDGPYLPSVVVDTEDNCFNHYYRNIILYFSGGGGEMQSNLKKITFHNDKNEGKGDGLISGSNVSVSSGDSRGWNEWSWEVYPDGTIKILAGDTVVQETNDDDYINDPYWGFWASSDIIEGAKPLWDWVFVEPLDP